MNRDNPLHISDFKTPALAFNTYFKNHVFNKRMTLMCSISVSIKNNGNFHGSETIFDVKTEGQSQQDGTGYLISCIYSGQLSAHSPRTHTPS